MGKLILILSLWGSSFVWANDSAGSIAAKEWLKIVDAGEYVESWQKSDAFLKSQLTQTESSAALTGVRTPLGQVKSRSELMEQKNIHHFLVFLTVSI